MTTPTVPPTSEEPTTTLDPCVDLHLTFPDAICQAVDAPPVPPERGTPIFLGTTPAGDCVSGSTQWTYEPCGESLTTTTAVNPADVQLPKTGQDLNVGLVAALFVAVGWVLVWKTRRTQ